MSKLGKKPIEIPKGTSVKVNGGKLTLTGPKGSSELTINDKIFATKISENNMTCSNKEWSTSRKTYLFDNKYQHI